MQLAVTQNKRGPRKLGGEEAVAEAQLVAKRDGGRLLHEERVGPCVDDELTNALREDDAARPRVALEHEHRAFPLAQLVRGRQTGDAGPDDCYVDVISHACASRYRCTCCASACT